MSLKIIFAGTPEFSVAALSALVKSPHRVVGVLSQPDRQAGRGKKIRFSAVKNCALQHNLNLYQPQTLKSAESHQWLQQLNPDVMVVIAYGLILPQAVLDIPRLGCINVHASLLPRWRGAAPIQRAIMAADSQTGVTIMQMDKGLDTGDILAIEACDIGIADNTADVHDRLSSMGAALLVETLQAIEEGQITSCRQDDKQACYAQKITKSEAEINWQETAKEINQKIRAYNPVPVAWTYYQQKTLRIWQSTVVDSAVLQPPGTIVQADKRGLIVATGDQALKVEVLQMPGRKPMNASVFLNAHRLENELLGAKAPSK